MGHQKVLQRPVCETAPLAEIAVPMLVSQPGLPTHSRPPPSSATKFPSSSTLRELLSSVAEEIEKEEVEGIKEAREFDFVSRTFHVFITMSPETCPKAQRPVPETSVPTELVVPTPSQVPKLEAPIPTRPIVRATTLGPMRPPSPPRLGPIALFLQSLELTYPPPHDYLYHIGVPTTPSGWHKFIFEPNYVLAYGLFDAFNPLSPNDPSGCPIDYCIYLYPTHGRLGSQSHFVYGGSHIHPVQIKDLLHRRRFRQEIH